MSSLHIEVLAKRISGTSRIPLGAMLGERVMKLRVEPATHKQMRRINIIYNAAKHDVDQPKDTHLFPVEDSVVVYITCRTLAANLYPKDHIKTDLLVFDKGCS